MDWDFVDLDASFVSGVVPPGNAEDGSVSV